MVSKVTGCSSSVLAGVLLVLIGCAGDDNKTTAPPITAAPMGGGGPGIGGPPVGGAGPAAAGGGVVTAGTTGGVAGIGTAGGGTGMMMVVPPMNTGGATAGGASGAGQAGMGGGMMSGGSGGSTVVNPPLTGEKPTLPMIKVECPQFKAGMNTIMIAGHGGVVINAGEKGEGGPLLFYWHGTGGSGAEAMRTLPAAVRMEILGAGGIIAAFNGSSQATGGGDCSGTGAHNKADFEAADQIAACAVMNYGIDARRIYSTGCSAGGLQTGCMAEMRSSYLAAVAPNSGGTVGNQPWQDMHSPAVFTMHGGASDMVIVTFSQTSMAFDTAAKAHGSFVVNCNHGGGHCQAPPALQTAAWQFMKDHPWGVKPSPWMGGIPAGIPDYCKIF